MISFESPIYENSDKQYIDVKAIFDKYGMLRPFSIYLDDDEFEVDRLIDIRPAASLKSGGAGIRYTCYIDGKRTYLFLENNRWFFEIVN